MDRATIKRQFLAYDHSLQAMVLLRLMFSLTIVARDIFREGENDFKLRAFHQLTEIHHKIVPFVIGTLLNETRYPDDVFIDILLDQLSAAGLDRYLSQAWEAAVQAMNSRGTKPVT